METKTYETVLKQQRKIIAIVCICSVIITLGSIAAYIWERNKKEEKIYVIADNGRFTAQLTEDAVVYDFDLKNHVRVFINKMFAYDQYSYKNHVEDALCLIDDYYGKYIYNNLKNNQVFETMGQYNCTFKVTIDSIKVDMNQRPFACEAYFKWRMYYSDQVKTTPIAFRCKLSQVNRSEKNPFGFIINNYTIINYKLPADQYSIKFDEVSQETVDSLLKSE